MGSHKATRRDCYGNGDKVQYTYDKQGRVTKQTYEDGDTVTYKYDNSGALATVTDSATGITTTYYYDFTERLMKYVESGSNYSHSVGYRYDTLNNLTALVETINGTERTTRYSYNDDNRIASITDSGADKNSSDDDISESYTYDSYGRIHTKVTSNGGTAILTETYTYKENTSDKPTNQVWKLTSEFGNETVVYEYSYDSNGNITAVEKTVGDTHTNTSYVYDSANQLIRENDQAANVTWVYTYDNAGNLLTKLQYPYSEGTLGSRIRTYTLGYTDSEWGDLQTHWCGGAFTYDAIGNLTHAGSFDYTWEHGRQLATMYGENVSGGNNDMTVDFTYDADGMRTGKVITKNNYHVHSYAETVTAPTCIAGGYTTYTCACGTTYTGAETPALGHALTGVGVEDGVLYTCSRCDYSALEDHTHSYSLNVVLPTCTESGYTSHTCDECGYSYTDNITEPWGHQTDDIGVCIRCGIVTIPIPPIIRPPVNPPIVSGMGDSGTSAYALNSDEAPILVSTETTTYSYIYNGGSLSQMQVTAAVTADGETTTTTHTLDFTYDASGGPVSVTYDGTVYFYATNLQGDVTAILNSSGTAVVDYTYSAWGSITSTNGSMKDTLGFYNPLRYRGYVYDQEVGLYYLQSRYYNAGLGRFNAPDAFASTGQGLLGNNMFAYCNNNPVVSSDPSGMASMNSFSEFTDPDILPWRNSGINLAYPPNVTSEIATALQRELENIRIKRLFMTLLLGDGELGQSMLYLDFYNLVNHKAPWDIKRQHQWLDTIGTVFPGKDVYVTVGDAVMTPEHLGNFAYGILGYAYGIPLEHLIAGSYYAAGFPTEGSPLANEVFDWFFVTWGYTIVQEANSGG